VLIPGCWSCVHSGDIRDCTCNRKRVKKDRVSELEDRVEKLEQRLTAAGIK
jgi:hypothetical protein